MVHFSLFKNVLMAATLAAGLAACGGSPKVTPIVLHGVVASGAALANATVTVVCNKAGGGVVTVVSTTDANGNYTVTADNGLPPCTLTATKVVNGQTVTLKSIAIAEGVANITPLTNMVVEGLIAAKGAASLTDLISPAYSPGPTDLAKAQAVVLTQINLALAASGKPTLPTGTNLLNQADFTIGGATDTVLDNLVLIGAVTATGQATPTLQATINAAVDAVVPNNPPGATGGT